MITLESYDKIYRDMVLSVDGREIPMNGPEGEAILAPYGLNGNQFTLVLGSGWITINGVLYMKVGG